MDTCLPSDHYYDKNYQNNFCKECEESCTSDAPCKGCHLDMWDSLWKEAEEAEGSND